jgi:lysozyme
MKIIDILQKLLIEQGGEGSDPKNPDVYPDQDEWGMDDAWTWDEWKIYYDALVKKGGETFAKKRFLKYWEVVQEGTGVVGDDGMDSNWFKEKGMWNEDEDRPYTRQEFEDKLKGGDNSTNLNKNLKDGSIMSVSQYDFFNHLKYSEGLKYESYADTGGVWTIGYGHTKGVKPNQTATDEQIRKWLLEDIVEYEECVRGIMSSWKKQGLKTYMITQGQFDAMVSFSFNAGCGGLRTSDFIQLTKEGKHEEAAQVMKSEKLTDKKGNKLRGLVIRRENESKMYLS